MGLQIFGLGWVRGDGEKKWVGEDPEREVGGDES